MRMWEAPSDRISCRESLMSSFLRSVATVAATLVSSFLLLGSAAEAQDAAQQWADVPPTRLTQDVYRLHTAEVPNIQVRVLARGLSHPWSLAFLPGGDILITERDGRLRIMRDGVLDPTPIAGVPAVSAAMPAGIVATTP